MVQNVSTIHGKRKGKPIKWGGGSSRSIVRLVLPVFAFGTLPGTSSDIPLFVLASGISAGTVGSVVAGHVVGFRIPQRHLARSVRLVFASGTLPGTASGILLFVLAFGIFVDTVGIVVAGHVVGFRIPQRHPAHSVRLVHPVFAFGTLPGTFFGIPLFVLAFGIFVDTVGSVVAGHVGGSRIPQRHLARSVRLVFASGILLGTSFRIPLFVLASGIVAGIAGSVFVGPAGGSRIPHPQRHPARNARLVLLLFAFVPLLGTSFGIPFSVLVLVLASGISVGTAGSVVAGHVAGSRIPQRHPARSVRLFLPVFAFGPLLGTSSRIPLFVPAFGISAGTAETVSAGHVGGSRIPQRHPARNARLFLPVFAFGTRPGTSSGTPFSVLVLASGISVGTVGSVVVGPVEGSHIPPQHHPARSVRLFLPLSAFESPLRTSARIPLSVLVLASGISADTAGTAFAGPAEGSRTPPPPPRSVPRVGTSPDTSSDTAIVCSGRACLPSDSHDDTAHTDGQGHGMG
ncbi:hypothetical protein SOVF_014020 [Spinacia oleracea]|nr:hypothetical protein SOVF_014020 [Spinacia oleracea]